MVAVTPHSGADSPSTHAGTKGRARYDEASLHRLETASSHDGSVRSRAGEVAPKQAWTGHAPPDKTTARYHATMHRSVATAAANAALAQDRSHMGSRGGGYGSVHGGGSTHSGGGSHHGSGGGGSRHGGGGGGGGGSRHGGPWGLLGRGGTGAGDQDARTWSQWWRDLWLQLLIHPGSIRYQRWFYFSVTVSLLAGWLEPYHMAFGGRTRLKDAPLGFWAISEYMAVIVFTADLVAKFFVAFFDGDTGMLVTSPARIARSYVFSLKFVFDLVSAVPLDWLVLDPMMAAGVSPQQVAGASFIKMIQLVRLYRLFEFFHLLDYSLALSQGALMVVRNTTYVFYVTHWAACMFYLIAQVEGLSDDSWVGRNAERFEGAPAVDQYLLSLYFSVSAFTGLGDGSLYAGTVPESAFMIVYLLFNLFLGAYILGTVTMLVVKGDERSKQFRDRMYTLADFSKTNELPQSLHSAMKEHLDVTFHAEHASDEQVLAIYPTTIRRKVLRHLYLQPVKGCYLFKGCKQRFLDAFLTAARVELFMPGVQILTPGDNVSELLLIVSGEVAVAQHRLNIAAAYGAFAASAGGASAQEDASSHHTTTTHYAAATASAAHQLKHGGLLPRADAGHRPFTAVGDSAHQPAASGSHHRVSVLPSGVVGMAADASTHSSAFGYGSTASGVAHDASTRSGYGGGDGGRRIPGSAFFSFISNGLDGWTHKGNANGGGGGPGGQALVRPQTQQGGPAGGARSLRFPPPAATAPLPATGNPPTGTAAPGGGRVGSAVSNGGAPADSSTHGSSVHSGVAAFDDGGNVQLRSAGSPMAEVPYFTDVPSHEGVTSTTVVRALSLPKAAWELLVEQFPAQARIVLENLQARHEGEMYTALHNAALHSQLTAEQLGTAVALIKAKDGLDSVDPQLVAETRAALTQSQMDQLIRLDDVRALVRAHVRKVDQMRTYRFLQQASGGDAETLRSMLNQGMSPNAADYDGRTGLMLAAASGHEEVVRLLLDHGAKADQQDRFGNSAMFEAVKAGHDKVIDLLLGYGASIGMDGLSVAGTMCTAVFEGDLVKLQRLLKAGAPPDACDYDKRCALHIAGAEGNLAAVKLLVEEGGADPGFQDRWGNTALDEARRVGAAPVVAYLERLMSADGRAAADERWRRTAKRDFLSAAATGDTERLARLLGGGAPPPCAHTALLMAASEGRADVITALARWSGGGVIARAGGLALLEAADMGHVGAVRALNRVGAQLLQPQPLQATGTAAKAYVEAGAGATATPGVGRGQLQALLYGAVMRGDLRVVAALLEAGVRVADAATAVSSGSSTSVESSSGSSGGVRVDTVLHVAASSGDLELVRLLVEVGGAPAAATNADGASAAALATAAAARHVGSRNHRDVSEYLAWVLGHQQQQGSAADGLGDSSVGSGSNAIDRPAAPLAPPPGTVTVEATATAAVAAAAITKYGPLPDYASDDGELGVSGKHHPRKARHAQKSKVKVVAYVDSSCSSDSSDREAPAAAGGKRGVSASRRQSQGGFGSRSGLGRVSSMRMLAQGPRDDVITLLHGKFGIGAGSAASTPTATASGHVAGAACGGGAAAAALPPALPGIVSQGLAAGESASEPAATTGAAMTGGGASEARGVFRVPSSDLLLAVDPASTAPPASRDDSGGGGRVGGDGAVGASGSASAGNSSRRRSALKPQRSMRPADAAPAAAAPAGSNSAVVAAPNAIARVDSTASVGRGAHWQDLLQEAGGDPAGGIHHVAGSPAASLHVPQPAFSRSSAPVVGPLPSPTAASASGRMGPRLSGVVHSAGEERTGSPSSRSALPPPPPIPLADADGATAAAGCAASPRMGNPTPAALSALPGAGLGGAVESALLLEGAASLSNVAAPVTSVIGRESSSAGGGSDAAAAAALRVIGSPVPGRPAGAAAVAVGLMRQPSESHVTDPSASAPLPMVLPPQSPPLLLGTAPAVSVTPRSSAAQLQAPQYYPLPQALHQAPATAAGPTGLAAGGSSSTTRHAVAWDRSVPSPRQSMRGSANGAAAASLHAAAATDSAIAGATAEGGGEALAVSASSKSLTEEMLKRLSPPTLTSITAVLAEDEPTSSGASGGALSAAIGASTTSPSGAPALTARTGAQLPPA